MTTAHRPTWKAAVGRAQEGGWGAGGAVSTLSSVRDVASHTKLKLRAGPQAVDKRAALQESLRKLEEAEASRKKALLDVQGGSGGGGRIAGLLTRGREANPEEEVESRRKMLKATADVDDVGVRAKYDDADDDGGSGSDDGGGGWSDLEDDDGGGAGEAEDESDLDASDSDDESDDDSDDEDEEAALQAELAKIRAEREAAKAKADAERDEEERAKLEEAALTGNPLLSSSDGGGATTGKLKRRWNDDVVFRNQARDEPDRLGKRRFINDTVRNDFHRRFLNKFIR